MKMGIDTRFIFIFLMFIAIFFGELSVISSIFIANNLFAGIIYIFLYLIFKSSVLLIFLSSITNNNILYNMFAVPISWEESINPYKSLPLYSRFLLVGLPLSLISYIGFKIYSINNEVRCYYTKIPESNIKKMSLNKINLKQGEILLAYGRKSKFLKLDITNPEIDEWRFKYHAS